MYNEPTVELLFLEDGAILEIQYLSLASGDSAYPSFDYTASSPGIHNLSICAVPVPGENITFNNQDWTLVEVVTVPDITVAPGGFDFVLAVGDLGQDVMAIENTGIADLHFNITDDVGSAGAVGDIAVSTNGGIIDGSENILSALSSLGYAYTDCGDTCPTSGYDVIIVCQDGGSALPDFSTFIDEGGHVIVFGGSGLPAFVASLNSYLTTDGSVGWHMSTDSPEWVSLNAHPITQYVPATYDYNLEEHTYHMTHLIASQPAGVTLLGGNSEPTNICAVREYTGGGSFTWIGQDINCRVDATDQASFIEPFVRGYLEWMPDASGGWLSESPTTGMAAPGATFEVDVIANATLLTPGYYQGNITIASNDPDEPEVVVPVNLTVITPLHDIAIMAIDVNSFGTIGVPMQINVTVHNQGASDETNVAVELYDGAILVGSHIIGSLASGGTTALTFPWSSAVEGLHVISALALAVPGEVFLTNNHMETEVTLLDAAPILVVDDDTGIDSEEWFEWALADNLYEFDTWHVSLSGNIGADYLAMYSVVIWLTGNDYETSFTSAERNAVSAYLSSGGKMYVSSSLAGYDAMWNGWSAWYETWFCTSYLELVNGVQTLPGIPADPIGNGLTLSTHTGDYCANIWGYGTSSATVGAGTQSFYFAGEGTPAMIKADTGIYKIVYSAFDFSDVNGMSTRAVLMYRILNWLGFDDTEPPQHSNEHPVIGAVIGETRPTVWVHVTDNVAVNESTVRLYVRGFPVFYDIVPIPGGYNVSYTHGADYAEGSVAVRIVARDMSENLLDFTWTFLIDLSPPVAWGIIPVPGGSTPDTTPTITLNVTDPGGVVRTTMRLYVQDFAVWYDWSAITGGFAVLYTHDAGFMPGELVRCRISAEDSFHHWLNYYWNFTISTGASCAIHVIAGWNLISIPMAPDDVSLPNSLQDDDGGVVWTRVMWYNPSTSADPWKQYNTAWAQSLNDLATVDNTMGVWLYVADAGDGYLNLVGGDQVATTMTLKAGWNLIGYPAADDSWFTVGDLKSYCTVIAAVEGFSAAAEYRTELLPDSRVLKCCEGYWVYATSDASMLVNW